MRPFVLASQSPRRKELLRQLGWDFRVVEPEIEEKAIQGEKPGEFCRRLALDKARAVTGKFPDDIVIAADTIVVLDGEIMGKPNDEGECRAMLGALSGRSHEVMTGVAACSGPRWLAGVETTRVSFRGLSEPEIDAYIATGEGKDKAGAYGIQGRGALLVSSIEGCYFNVVGLPLHRLSLILGELGISLARQWEGSR